MGFETVVAIEHVVGCYEQWSIPKTRQPVEKLFCRAYLQRKISNYSLI
jgi:hypothetical protein